MAQSFHETQQYTKWVEDLTYKTAARLPAVYPTRFSLIQNDPSGKLYAPDYLYNSEKVANAVYADRFGNGNVASGDGFKYRGRGAFHLTFKANYLNVDNKLNLNGLLVTNPDLVSTDWEYRWLSAGVYWADHNLNPLADADQFTKVSVVIQGDASTVQKRLESLNRANSIFKQ